MLRKNRPIATQGSFQTPSAGMPINTNYVPQNVYKEIGSKNQMNSLDVTDPFAKMHPNNIPVPGTSIWTNPSSAGGQLGNAYDMMGMIASFDNHQRATVNPLELYACQNEGPSVLHPEVQPIYEGCRRLILNGKMDVGYCCYQNKIVNFGRLFLDKETYIFPYRYMGYKKNEISVFIVKYRTPNILLQLEPLIEFNDELLSIGQLAKSSATVMNYFYIAWAYAKSAEQLITDFKI